MSGPTVTIDSEKIKNNANSIVSLCRNHGIEVTGVTKATCGMPQVARAMLRGGVASIGESRLKNIERLRANGIHCPLMLLRIPPLSLVDEVVTSVDISLNSEFAVIKALSRAAEKRSLSHEIILMVDLGDLREGIWPEDLIPLVEKVVELPGVKIVGLGTNLTCYGGVLPSPKNMGAFIEYAEILEHKFNLKLRYLSGGNSSALPLLAAGEMPKEINHLRIGEAILLGRETIHRQPWPGTVQDAFLLAAELIELKEKPSLPIGEIGEDAFGGKPVFEDRGKRIRGILNVGREDIDVEGIKPIDPRIIILGASSDHLLVDVTDVRPPVALGDNLKFQVNYAALLASMTSEYVEKEIVFDRKVRKRAAGICVIGASELLDLLERANLSQKLTSLGYQVFHSEVSSEESSSVISQVEGTLARGFMPLLLGQDHRTSLAGLLGSAESLDGFGLIWIDTRASFMPADQSTREQSDSAILSSVFGYDSTFALLKSRLSAENVALIGLQEVKPEEAELIDRSRVKVFTMEDVDALGIREVMHQSLRTATAGDRRFYVSFCPAATEYPGAARGVGGLTYRETHQAMEIIAQSGLMSAMDVVGLNPALGTGLTAEVTNFMMSCFGKKIMKSQIRHGFL